MRFNRTEHYYNAVQSYREGLRAIWADYDKAMQRIETSLIISYRA